MACPSLEEVPEDYFQEVVKVANFFRHNLGQELDIVTSLFEGVIHRERMRVSEVLQVGPHNFRVWLVSLDNKRSTELNLDRFSYATVTKDEQSVEIGQLLGDRMHFRLSAYI